MGFLSLIFGSNTRKVKNYMAKGAVLLDVRTDREFRSGAIEGASHIPLNQIRQRISEIRQWDKPIVVYCAGGVRASKAAKFLNLENIDAVNGGGMLYLKRVLGTKTKE